MKIIQPSTKILEATPNLEYFIETCGRVCYKSEGRQTAESAGPFIRRCIDSQHESVLEHGAISVRFICDRGVSHELVRHRIASFSQESTRYCNYSKECFDSHLTFIEPFFWTRSSGAYTLWLQQMVAAETTYLALLNGGASAQEARSVLPNSLKTELIITANPREWRKIFHLRCALPAHPQMRQLMQPLAREFAASWPFLFEEWRIEA